MRTVTLYGLWHLEGKLVDVTIAGVDLDTATVTDGTVSVTTPDEMDAIVDGLKGSPDDGSASTGTLTFDSGYISDVEGDSVDFVGSQVLAHHTGGVIRGEDKRFYYITKGTPTQDGWYVIDAQVPHTILTHLDVTTLDNYVLDNQEQFNSSTGDLGSSSLFTSADRWIGGYMWPESPYFMIQGQVDIHEPWDALSFSTKYMILMWFKINKVGAVEFVTGALVAYGLPSLDTSGQDLGNVVAVGNLPVNRDLPPRLGKYHAQPNGPDIGFPARMIIAYSDSTSVDGTADPNLWVINPPTLNFKVVRTEEDIGVRTESMVFTRYNFETPLGSSFWAAHPGSGSDQRLSPYLARAFFLPIFDGSEHTGTLGNNNALLLCTYVGLSEIIAANSGALDANDLIDSYAGTYPDGFIVGMRIKSEWFSSLSSTVHGGNSAARYGADVLTEDTDNEAAPVILNDRFESFPFAEAGHSFTDVASNARDDYCNPSVYPTDVNDQTKPWLIFFPFNYGGDQTHIDFCRIKVYEWNPRTLTARLLGDEKGQTFDVDVDLTSPAGGNNRASNIVVHWDRYTDTVYLLITSQPASHIGSRNIWVKFGTFHYTPATFIEKPGVMAVGLNYIARAQVPRYQIKTPEGKGTVGKNNRIDQAAIRFIKSGLVKLGVNFAEMDTHVLTDPDENGIRPLFTGVYEGGLPGSYGPDNMVSLEQDRPAPCAVSVIAGFFDVMDK